jgi:hypothetical protein
VRLVIKFLVNPAGRATRIVAGIALLAAGFVTGGIAGIVIGAIGLVPLVAGIFDVCVFAPMFGYFFSGPRTRSAA